MVQLSLSSELKGSDAFGGSLNHGKRKTSRPLNSKKAVHIVFRAPAAKGNLSLLQKQNAIFIRTLLQKLSKKYFITVYEFANSGNHLHLLVRFNNRALLQHFLRTYPALIARFVTGARKGKPFGQRFWEKLVWTRIVAFGRAFRMVLQYVVSNRVRIAAAPAYALRPP
ncbi:MAG: transposase [Deltaproteobacteria bacterium]|nr:transposase [Deltaproteobacteria bacterium]